MKTHNAPIIFTPSDKGVKKRERHHHSALQVVTVGGGIMPAVAAIAVGEEK